MTTRMVESRARARPLAVLALCAVVLASALAGAAIDRLMVRASMRAQLFPDTTFHPLSTTLRAPTAQERQRLRQELAAQLDLTPAQDSAVDSIMRQRAGEFGVLREEIRPRVERLLADVRTDIEQVLTPAQRTRFRQLQQRGQQQALGLNSTP